MADLPESNEWVPGIYQLETSDPVLGGPEGIDNLQAKQLASRTRWMRDQLQKVIDGVTLVGKATQLATARTFRFKGAATGSANFDGSADAEITLSLADSGIPAGSYTRVSVNAKGLAVGGANPTTLDGYGITDALPTRGGSLKGNLILEPGWGVLITPADTESWATGVHVADAQGVIYASTGFWGNKKTMRSAYLGLGPTAWATGNGVRVTTESVTIEGRLVADGSGLRSVPFSALAELPTTLQGYGVTMASQGEAEQGSDTTKPMNALRVWQAIAAKVVQATESALGIARVASQTAVNAGVDALSFVTPKTLGNGLQMLIGTHGFIRAPSWLGGIMLQWGTGPQIAAGQTLIVTYPMSYPNSHFMTLVCNNYSLGGASVASSLGVLYGGKVQFTVSATGPNGQASIPWFSIGY